MLRKPQRLITAAITAFWLVMVALFIYREGWFAPAVTPPVTQGSSTAQEGWMGIFLDGGKRVGRIHWKSTPETRQDRGGSALELDASVETSLLGFDAGMEIGGNAWTADDGASADFSFSLTSSGHSMTLTGALADRRLKGTLNTGGQDIPLDFPVEPGLLSGDGLGLPGSAMPDLDPGESMDVPAFDPISMKMAKATITCVGQEAIEVEGETVNARLFTTRTGGFTSKAWLGPDGEILQASTPFGLLLKKIAPESGTENVDAAAPGDLIASLAVRASGEVVRADATNLVLRIKGLAPDQIPANPPWQRWEGDRLVTTGASAFPTEAVGPFDPGSFEADLGGDAFITTEHPEVAAKSAEIVGDERDPARRARRIYDWVFENIEKVPVLSVPSAPEVLRERTGDCNEHTILFTALARAAGLPCRVAIGLVYSEKLNAFGYHAWPEVYVGAWYPMDPTLGQPVADATHIKLLEGGIEKWVQLASFVGQMEVEVLEAD